jgi:hypothetical protein
VKLEVNGAADDVDETGEVVTGRTMAIVGSGWPAGGFIIWPTGLSGAHRHIGLGCIAAVP